MHGLQNVETAITFGLCAHTVGSYIRKYKEGSLQSLVLIPKPGAPHMFTKEQEQQLVKIITTKTPDEAGFPSRKNWNAILIKECVKTILEWNTATAVWCMFYID